MMIVFCSIVPVPLRYETVLLVPYRTVGNNNIYCTVQNDTYCYFGCTYVRTPSVQKKLSAFGFFFQIIVNMNGDRPRLTGRERRKGREGGFLYAVGAEFT